MFIVFNRRTTTRTGTICYTAVRGPSERSCMERRSNFTYSCDSVDKFGYAVTQVVMTCMIYMKIPFDKVLGNIKIHLCRFVFSDFLKNFSAD